MTLLVHYALEIEASGGNQGEARLQLATFHAAALLKLKNFFFARSKPSEPHDIPPLLSWTVVGHEWRCFVTSFTDDGNLVCLPSLCSWYTANWDFTS